MKAPALLAAVVCLGVLLPSPTAGQVTAGFTFGLNFASLHGDDVSDDLDGRTGIILGGFIEKALTDQFSIQPELRYAQKGATDSGSSFDVTLKIDYIEVPVLLKVNFPTEGQVSPHLLVGPVFGFNSGCTISGDDSEGSVDQDCEDDDIDPASFELSGMVGGGVSFPAGPGEVTFGARYQLGLTNVNDTEGDDEAKLRAFSLVASFGFPVGG